MPTLPPCCSELPLGVWISTMPAVRRPNCAGSAPVISARLPTKLVPRTWPKPEMPSGKMMPLMRYCTLACSLRTWMSPLTALSCETPGACSKTELIGPSVPCGRVSMKARFMSKVLAPKRGDRLSRSTSNFVFWAARVALLSSCGDGAAVGRGGAGRCACTTISGSTSCASAKPGNTPRSTNGNAARSGTR